MPEKADFCQTLCEKSGLAENGPCAVSAAFLVCGRSKKKSHLIIVFCHFEETTEETAPACKPNERAA
jgi:hypothetical protein